MVLEAPYANRDKLWDGIQVGMATKLERFYVAISGFTVNSTMLWDPKLRSHLV